MSPSAWSWWARCNALILAAPVLFTASVWSASPQASPRAAASEDDSWTGYGRGAAETRHSPLRQITTANVDSLALAWTLDVGEGGKLETTPVVSDGVLYATLTWSRVVAVDLRSRRLMWQWDPEVPRRGRDAPRVCCGPVNRGVALQDDLVFVGVLDGRLVALDSVTGRPVWTVQTTPEGSDYSITGAPRVAGDLVVIGNAGAEFGVRGYVSAYDGRTGRLEWRFFTVPGDPAQPFEDPALARAAKTWTGDWWRYGGGGTVWDALAYDPDANLLYVGTGNGSPWNHEHRSPGGGDNLYLSSIVSLEADTGAYVWHYQTTPADTWDYTATQTLVLADVTIEGRRRQVIMQAPKNGFFYVLDRLTGELLSARPFAKVTWATGIDMTTGRPIENPEARYGPAGALVSPSHSGAHHWPPMAWNPATGLAYIPAQDSTAFFARLEEFSYEPGRWNVGVWLGRGARRPAGAVRSQSTPFLLAWDPRAQTARWRLDLPQSGGVLSTAGGLVFAGTGPGRLVALDAATGRTLWTHALSPGVATPISYAFDGTQYVAVVSGTRRARVWAFAHPS